MEKIKGYDKAEVFKEVEKLPAGGYIIGILGADEVNYDWGKVLEIKFDIAEGEYMNFYSKQYMQQSVGIQPEDKKYKGVFRMNIPEDDDIESNMLSIRIFKSNIAAIEESNPGYHWDWNEKTLVGKKVGCIFFFKEYEINGRRGFFTAPHSFRTIEEIKNGKYKIPAPKLLKQKDQTTQGIIPDFMRDDVKLPFDFN